MQASKIYCQQSITDGEPISDSLFRARTGEYIREFGDDGGVQFKVTEGNRYYNEALKARTYGDSAVAFAAAMSEYLKAVKRGCSSDDVYLKLITSSALTSPSLVASYDTILLIANDYQKRNPNDKHICFLKGKIFMKSDKFKEAAKEFECAVANKYYDRESWYYLGYCKYKADDLHDNSAMDAFKKVISVVYLPTDHCDYYSGQAHLFLGVMYWTVLNNKDSAMLEFNQAILCNKYFDAAYFKRGLLKSDLTDYTGAIADLSKAIKIDSLNTTYYLWRGNTFATRKDYDKALKDYDKGIENEINYNIDSYEFADKDLLISLHIHKGVIYLNELKDKEKACEEFSKAGELGDMRAYDLIKSNCHFNSEPSTVIKLTKSVGSLYTIPVTINGVLKISFIFDSGASDVSISSDIASTLIKTGTVSESDFIGTQKYTFADGSNVTSKVFLIKEMNIGNKKIQNVRASISNSLKAPMLLGQSVLQRFGKFTIDNINHTVSFGE